MEKPRKDFCVTKKVGFLDTCVKTFGKLVCFLTGCVDQSDSEPFQLAEEFRASGVVLAFLRSTLGIQLSQRCKTNSFNHEGPIGAT